MKVCAFPDQIFGGLQEGVHKYHEEWGLLSSPRKLPERPSKMIADFVKKCQDDPIYAGTIATLRHTEIAKLQLTDEELEGEPIKDADNTPFKIIHDRQLVDESLTGTGCLNSKFSVVVELEGEAAITSKLNEMLPPELFPGELDTIKSVLQKNDDCLWLDEGWRHGKTVPTNGDETSHQPVRRSLSVSEDFPSLISNPKKGEEGLYSSKMYVYTCREMPVSKWMMRPATNGELATVCEIWEKCWGLLRSPSRRAPPNGWQILVYQRILGRKMGLHRDNFARSSLKALSEDPINKCPFKEDQRWSGVRNSQVYGTCVIVYSFGNCPMRMVFHCLNPKGGAYQGKKEYEVNPSFCFEFRQGYVCILDSIDDLLMLHGLEFVGVKVDGDPNKLVRAAIVMRRLDNLQEFYSHDSTLVFNEDTIKYKENGAAAQKPIRKRRSAWT